MTAHVEFQGDIQKKPDDRYVVIVFLGFPVQKHRIITKNRIITKSQVENVCKVLLRVWTEILVKKEYEKTVMQCSSWIIGLSKWSRKTHVEIVSFICNKNQWWRRMLSWYKWESYLMPMQDLKRWPTVSMNACIHDHLYSLSYWISWLGAGFLFTSSLVI